MNTIVNKYFRHHKNKYYYVLNISTHTETNEKLVNYINLYGDVQCWSRPLVMWDELVDGKPRFIEVTPIQEHIKIMNDYMNRNQ
jgi:hypothetical protein